jgi:hypothetical protein
MEEIKVLLFEKCSTSILSYFMSEKKFDENQAKKYYENNKELIEQSLIPNIIGKMIDDYEIEFNELHILQKKAKDSHSNIADVYIFGCFSMVLEEYFI